MKTAGPDSAVVMLEDLSGVAVARRRLQEAEWLETVGRLAGGVAHDFNNVLIGVWLYCDLLMSGLGPSDRARKYAEEIRKAGLQATGLVRQLLTVVRANKSSPRPVSLNEVAEAMRNLLVRLIGENIELKLKLDSGLGLVKLDPVQAQQILLHLVPNARDALPVRRTYLCRDRQLQDADSLQHGGKQLRDHMPILRAFRGRRYRLGHG
jgi:two-component system cell cycle sensor histidine kinase/response regulator CckA